MANVKTARKTGPDFVESLARGLDVIQAFSAETPEMTLAEVAVRTGLNPASARRALLTLSDLGYVGMNGKRYVLCAKVLSLGAAYLSSMNLRDVADSFLQSVADRFHDAASLAVKDGDEVLYVSHISSDRNIRFKARVGFRLPAYATSLGRVLMANESEEEQNRYLGKGRFETYTAKTTVDPNELRAILRHVREQDYAVVQDQLEYGVVAAAVPVRDRMGRVVAAVNCSSLTTRVDAVEMTRTRVPALQTAARQISAALERYPALIHSVYSQR